MNRREFIVGSTLMMMIIPILASLGVGVESEDVFDFSGLTEEDRVKIDLLSRYLVIDMSRLIMYELASVLGRYHVEGAGLEAGVEGYLSGGLGQLYIELSKEEMVEV